MPKILRPVGTPEYQQVRDYTLFIIRNRRKDRTRCHIRGQSGGERMQVIVKRVMGRGLEPVLNEYDMVKVCPTRLVHANGELADMCQNHRTIGIRHGNGLDQPIVKAAGNQGSVWRGIYKKKILMVLLGGATEECAEGCDRTDQRTRQSWRSATSSLILIATGIWV